MLRLLGRILVWLRSESLRLLILAGLLLLVWGIIAPVGTVVWWLNQEAENLGFKRNSPAELVSSLRIKDSASTSNQLIPRARNDANISCYIVFLPGVGDFSADQITEGEKDFLDRLVESHPDCVAIQDVFPYSTIDEGRGSRPVLAPLWKFAHEADGVFGIANVLIKVRNLWQFAISADERYGPIYNQGIATIAIERMNAIHTIPKGLSQPLQVVLIGTSGGAQVALGAAPYLKRWLNAQITVVSVGGVFNGKNGFDEVKHVYQVRGCKDWIEKIGGVVFPSRWFWTVGSPFNRAHLRNDYTAVRSDCQEHDGNKGYFGEAIALQDGTTYVDLTLQTVTQLPLWSEVN